VCCYTARKQNLSCRDTVTNATDRKSLLEVCLIVERLDRVAAADGAALLDSAIESGPIVQREINRLTEKLLKVSAGKIEPAADEDAVADAETAANQMIEWNTNHGEVAAMVGWFQIDGAELKWRVGACQCLQYFHLEQSYLAKHIGLSRISASAKKIPVAFDAAACDKVCLFNFYHRERRGRCDVDMQKPTAGPVGSACRVLSKRGFHHIDRLSVVATSLLYQSFFHDAVTSRSEIAHS